METVAVAKWAQEFQRLRATMPPMEALRATYPLREREREVKKVVRLMPALKEAA